MIGANAQPAGDPAALIVLTKAPVPGFVKTRLCPPATPDQAADLAAAAMLDVLDAVRAVQGVHPVVALAGRLTEAARADELAAAMATMTVFAQRGDGLGPRIAAAHREVAALLPGRPALQISTDTPQVDAELLGECLATLVGPGVDAVLGPATDGGWWALGLRDPRLAALIADVPTSRADTGARSVDALRQAGLRVALLPRLTDVDTISEVAAVAATLAGSAPAGRFAGTAAALLAGELAVGSGGPWPGRRRCQLDPQPR